MIIKSQYQNMMVNKILNHNHNNLNRSQFNKNLSQIWEFKLNQN